MSTVPLYTEGKESLYPKIHTEKKKEESPIEDQVSETLISAGDFSFKIGKLKNGMYRQLRFMKEIYSALVMEENLYGGNAERMQICVGAGAAGNGNLHVFCQKLAVI